MTLPIKIKVLPGGRLPVKASEGASGFDLFARVDGTIMPGQDIVPRAHAGNSGPWARVIAPVVRIPLGVAFEIPLGWEGQVRGRSGLGLKGILTTNPPGTIDSDYRGEVMVGFYNFSGEDFVIRDGDRVAQIVFQRVPEVSLVQADELGSTERGAGGFGSTGTGRISWENENRPANAPRLPSSDLTYKLLMARSAQIKAGDVEGSGPLTRPEPVTTQPQRLSDVVFGPIPPLRHTLHDEMREETHCTVCKKTIWQKSGEVIFGVCPGTSPSQPSLPFEGEALGDPDE